MPDQHNCVTILGMRMFVSEDAERGRERERIAVLYKQIHTQSCERAMAEK